MNIILNGQYYIGFQRSKVLTETGALVDALEYGELHTAILDTIAANKVNAITQLEAKKNTSSDQYMTYIIDIQIANIIEKYNTALTDLDRMELDVLWNYNTDIFSSILNNVVIDLASEVIALQQSLDNETGKVRQIVLSKGALIDQEYLAAYDEAKTWVDDGALDESAPKSVTVWADICDSTNIEAAENIISIRTMFNTSLLALRNIRLLGKHALTKATSIVDANNIFNTFKGQLDAVAAQLRQAI